LALLHGIDECEKDDRDVRFGSGRKNRDYDYEKIQRNQRYESNFLTLMESISE
jgi:hypothetical protein